MDGEPKKRSKRSRRTQLSQQQAQPEVGMDGGPKIRVLLLERDAQRAERLSRDVLCVSTVDEAVERVRQGGIDALLVDLSSAGAHSLDDVARLHVEVPEVPVVVLTGGDDRTGAKILAAGADGYVSDDASGALRSALLQAVHRKRADTGNSLEERRFQALIENSTDGILLVDSAAKVLYSSPGLHRILGYIKDERLGASLFDFIHPEDVGTVTDLYARVVSAPGSTVSAQIRVKHKDGSWLWVEGSATNHLDDPAVGAIVINFRDVKDRRQAEELLRASERRFRALIENSTDAVVILAPDGCNLYHSPSFKRLLGYEPWENIGVSFAEFLHPEDVEAAAQIMAEVIANPGVTKGMEGRAKMKDGSWRWIEGRATSYVADPAVQGIVINLRDITERKQSEEALSLKEEFYRKLTEKSPDGIAIVDAQGSLVYKSPSLTGMLGYGELEDLGISVAEWIHPDDVANAMASLAGVLATPGASGQVQMRIRHEAGGWRWMEAVGTNHLQDPAVKGIVVNMRDIDDRKRAEETLRAKDKYFRAIMDQASEAVLVVAADGRIADVTGGLECISGYSKDRTVGASAGDFLHPEDLEKTGQAFAEAMQNPSKTVSFEARLRHANGTWQWTECMITNLLDHPDVRGIVTHLRDISDRRRAEEALAAKEKYFRSIMDLSSDGVMVLNSDGTMAYMSRGMEQMSGVPADKARGTMQLDFIHPEDLEKVSSGYLEALQSPGKLVHREIRGKMGDGSWRWLECSVTNLVDNPEVWGLVVHLRDITERKWVEETLRQSEERHRLLADTMTDMVFIVDLTPGNDFRVTYRSPSLKRATGFPDEESESHTAVQMMTPDSVASSFKVLMEELEIEAKGEGGPGRSRVSEVELYRKDGTTFPVEVHTTFLRNAEGKPVGFLGVARDITERRQAEEQLRDSERRFRALIENSADGMLLLDAMANVKYVSPGATRLIGYDVDESLGFAGFDFVHPEDIGRVVEMYTKVSAAPGSSASDELRVKHKDGSWWWVQGVATNHLDDPAVAAIVINIRDISARKKAEEALRESERRYRAFFENPLNLVYVCDALGVFVDANDQAFGLLGRTRDDLGKLKMQDVVHPDDLGRTLQEFGNAVAKGFMEHPIEIRLVAKTGEVAWVETYVHRLQRAGEAPLFLGVARDITDRRQAEQALKAREEFYSRILSQVEVGVSVIKVDGTIGYQSAAALRMWGNMGGSGALSLDIIHPDDLPRMLGHVGDMLQKKASVITEECRIRQDDGSYRWASVTGTDCVDDPVVRGILMVISDITERRNIEDKLRVSEERFRGLIEHSADGIAILSPEGAVLYGSPGLARMMGYSDDETIGFSFAEFLHPEDIMSALGVLGQIMNTPGASGKLEVRGKHKDGSWHWFEARATNHVKDAAIGGIVINLRDITDRRKAEDALKSREEFYTRVLGHVEAAIMVIDTTGQVTYQSASGERLWGKVSESGGTIGFNVIHPDDLPNIMTKFMETLQGKYPMVTVECRIKHPDGTWHWAATTGTSCLADPLVGGFVLVTTDITERKKIEDAVKQYAETLSAQNVQLDAARKELSELNQSLEQKVNERTGEVVKLVNQKEAFISQLSHDLKTPLTPLVTILPIIKDGEDDPEQVELLDAAITNVNYMKELVTKTLRLVKLSSSDSGAIGGGADVRRDLEAVIRGRMSAADKKGIVIDPQVEQGLVVPIGQADLQEIFDHLVFNAIKFTPEGGMVTVSATKDDRFATISVKDTGIGMTPEQLSHLFEEFYKADPSRHELDASGLGLAICKRLVERAGGKIWADSEGLGKGSTFCFTLPLSTPETGTKEGQPDRPAENNVAGQPALLDLPVESLEEDPDGDLK